MSYACTNAVISCISATYYHDVLALCGNVVFIRKAAVQQRLSCGFQKIHCKIDTLCISALGFDISRV